jgi:hypothetical protein
MKKILASVLLTIVVATLTYAMGTAPKKEEPKYKLEILKMEVVPAAPRTLESVSKKGKKGEPKYKLEILKMDIVPAAPSKEAKNAQ